MKRIVIAVLSLFVCFSLFASFSGIISANPSVFISNYPLLSLGENRHVSGSEEAGWFETAQDYYYRYFRQEGLLDLGLRLLPLRLHRLRVSACPSAPLSPGIDCAISGVAPRSIQGPLNAACS